MTTLRITIRVKLSDDAEESADATEEVGIYFKQFLNALELSHYDVTFSAYFEEAVAPPFPSE
jgi:hypothetical protein